MPQSDPETETSSKCVLWEVFKEIRILKTENKPAQSSFYNLVRAKFTTEEKKTKQSNYSDTKQILNSQTAYTTRDILHPK